mmetsp:Transcript_29106/g.63191  ORF Transcript_29106/g.63191 Transcript_29106/m.63191 type:complete len:352 (+) Transcript_29106:41-1096(+)
MSADNEEEDMTPEEREEWLKDHGVIIEAPGAATSPSTSAIIHQLRGDDVSNEIDGVQLALVPHDISQPIRSVRLPPGLTRPGTGDAAVEFVKPYFASNKSSIDASLLNDQAQKQFAGGNLQGLDTSKISIESMNAVAAQGSVETFPLVHPAESNKYQGVYVYLDEVGLLKKLPTNTRAAEIAASCGYNPPPSFYGDVFIGRVVTRPAMKNIDFVVGKDTDRGAEWMKRAVSENVAWQQEMNKVTGQAGQSQPSVVGSEGNAVQEFDFSWTQDEEEVEIVVEIDSDIDKRAVKVTFLPNSVKVEHKGEDALNVKLYDKIDVDGCTWTLDGKTKLVLTLEKGKSGAMWPRIKE